jgi:hypothetical protein
MGVFVFSTFGLEKKLHCATSTKQGLMAAHNKEIPRTPKKIPVQNNRQWRSRNDEKMSKNDW